MNVKKLSNRFGSLYQISNFYLIDRILNLKIIYSKTVFLADFKFFIIF